MRAASASRSTTSCPNTTLPMPCQQLLGYAGLALEIARGEADVSSLHMVSTCSAASSTSRPTRPPHRLEQAIGGVPARPAVRSRGAVTVSQLAGSTRSVAPAAVPGDRAARELPLQPLHQQPDRDLMPARRSQRRGERAHVLQRRAAAALDHAAHRPEPRAGCSSTSSPTIASWLPAQPQGVPRIHASTARSRRPEGPKP